MNFLPVAQRELRVAARSAMTYYSRCIAAIVAAAICLGVVTADFSGSIAPGSCGEQAFAILSALAYLFVIFEGTLLTCDCLSLEKREGTLGLLFLTTLRPHDIIAGKLVPYTGRTLLYIIAVIPASAIAFILGGVAWDNVLMMFVALVNALFFSAAVGLLVSACCWHEHHATGYAFGFATLFSLVLPIISYWEGITPGTPWQGWISFGPSGAFLAAVGSAFDTLPDGVFTASLLTSQFVAWSCLIAAGFVLPRLIRHKPEQATETKKRIPRKRKPVSPDGNDLQAQIAVIGAGSDARISWGLILLLLGSGLVLALSAVIANPARWPEPVAFIVVIMVMHLALKFIVAHRACRAWVNNRSKSELEMLLTTPVDQKDVIQIYVLGLKRQLFTPVLLVLGVDLALCFGAWAKSSSGEEKTTVIVVFVLEFVWLVMNLYSLTWVGLCQGMKSRSTVVAIQRTLALVLIVPWAVFLCTLAGIGLIVQGLKPELFLAGMAWFAAVVLFCNCGATAWAINELQDSFRELAAHQFVPLPKRRPWDARAWLRRFFLLDAPK